MILEQRVTEQEGGMRLSRYLPICLGLQNGYISRLKPLNAFSVNGTPVHASCILRTGDVAQVDLSAPPPDFPPESGPLEILYKDEALLAVNKPPGMLVHPSAVRLRGTLANLVLGHYEETGQRCAVHILTRLDRDTQGVVLFSKKRLHPRQADLRPQRRSGPQKRTLPRSGAVLPRTPANGTDRSTGRTPALWAGASTPEGRRC